MRSWLVLALLVADVAAFKFLTNFKVASLIPRPSALLKRRKAAKTFGDKKLAVITGTSSGVGLETAARLIGTGEYHVFGAVRDLDKMRSISNEMDFSADDFTPLQVELDSFESVRAFCKDLEKCKLNRPIDRLICNAATYEPDETPKYTVDGHEQTLQVNFLSHFLLVSLLLPGMAMAPDPRVVMVGGAGAEEGVGVYPRAGLGALEGLKAGGTNPISMVDGSTFFGAKSYKDSKLCLGMFSNMLHRRYHKQTGIAFSTIYPGTISESALVAGKPPLDTSVGLPDFVKAIADLELSALKSLGLGDGLHADGLIAPPAEVATAEAGGRLFQVAYDVRCSRSGYWSWKEGEAAAEAAAAAEDGAAEGGGAGVSRAGWESIYENEPSGELLDVTLGQALWKQSTLLTGASWPPANVPKSPCPTLKVVGAVTKAMNAKEEAKRTLHGIEPAEGGIVSGLGGKVLGGTGYVVDAIGGNTLGLVAKLAQDKLLGDIPTDAIEGTYQQSREEEDLAGADAEADAEGADEVMAKLDDALAGGLKIRTKSLN